MRLKDVFKHRRIHKCQAESLPETGKVGLYQLSAQILDESAPNYKCVCELNEQIHNPEVNNIALTGAYGAGKTSIIKTLTSGVFHDIRHLCISLANFKVTKSDDDNIEFDPKDEEELNRLLEYSIIQQLIYREDQDTLPESRFKRIKNVSPKTISKIAGCVILFFVCLLIIFTPSFLQSTTIYQSFVVPYAVKLGIDILCSIISIGLLFVFISSIVRVWVNSKLNKITIKDMEVGFNNEETNSILNKHIDEVLYYFEKTDYNVVIIEDLDRFKTPLIFSKLREINALINAYKPIRENPKRNVVFIYAIRDDLFINNTLRTKFFDVIIPVIPIVDPSNAGSKLKMLLSEKEPSDATQIKDCIFKDLGRFVAEMRLIKTIVNDYLMYRGMLSPQLQPANLLAMMAYKNFYPQDFIALSHQKGLLFSVLDNKQVFTKKLQDKKDEQIKQLKQQITEIEAQKVKSLKELKDLYLYRLLHKYNSLTHLVDTDNKIRSVQDIYTDEDLFRRLTSGKITQYAYLQYGNHYEQTFGQSFSSIQSEVDPKHTYVQRAELWNKRENGEIGRLTQKIQHLEGEKLELPYKPIAELFVAEIKPDIDDFIHSQNKGGLDSRLLFYVLQSGLIDSNYYDYISFFHPGLLSSSDNEFLMNITSKRNTPFSHLLHKHEALVEEIPLPTFKYSYILNFSLLNFLCSNPQKYSRQLAYIFEQLKEADGNKIAFVKEFVTTNDAAGKFLKLFSKSWDGLWPFIEDDLAEDAETFAYLFVKHLSAEEMKGMNKDLRFSQFLDKHFDLFGVWETQIDVKKLIDVIDKLGLVFHSIDPSKISVELFQFIEAKSHYDITGDNIKAILKFHDKIDLLDQIDKAHYSSVLESGIESLIGYVENNLDYYADKVLNLIEPSKEENEAALIKIINSDSVSEEAKKKYLRNQSGWISDIESIEAELWDLAFNSLIVFPTWANVMKYYGKRFADNPSEPLRDGFYQYLADEAVYSKLTDNKVYTQSDNGEAITSLFNDISSGKSLSDECYKNLLKPFDREVLLTNIDFSWFSEAKIKFLIDSGFMPYNVAYLEQIKSHAPELVPAYLMSCKEGYLENVGDISLNSSQYSKLLTSDIFSANEKIAIAESINSDELNGDPKLAALMCRAILDSSFGIDEELLKEIIGLCEDEQLKTEIVFKFLQAVTYDENVVSEYLNLLSKDYQRITVQGKKPRIPIESHGKLLDYLKNKGYLKNVISHDTYVRVINRA